jgi:hypothetical protein
VACPKVEGFCFALVASLSFSLSLGDEKKLGDDDGRPESAIMARRSSRSSRRQATTATRRQPRFDLSHLSPEEGHATLQALVRDLCFWGDLTVAARPTLASSSHGASPVVVASKASLHRQPSTSSRSSSSTSSSRRSSRQRQRQEATWKTATDALTGQTYYYDTLTRVTQWEKVRTTRHLSPPKHRHTYIRLGGPAGGSPFFSLAARLLRCFVDSHQPLSFSVLR